MDFRVTGFSYLSSPKGFIRLLSEFRIKEVLLTNFGLQATPK